MSTLSYFQRYSQPENHLTNNTLLMLRYLYSNSTDNFDNLISELCDINCTSGLSFEQQVSDDSDYCFDALISQKAIDIYIETKRGTQLDDQQIERYLEHISRAVNTTADGINRTKLLIGLTSGAVDEQALERLSKRARSKNVIFSHITFQQLLNSLESICLNRGDEIDDIYQDYEDYLREEGVLIRDVMKAFPCRHTLDHNLRNRMYTVGADTPRYLNARVIGFYQNKCVTHVAKVNTIVEGVYDDKRQSFEILHPLRGQLSKSEESRVITMNKEHRELIGNRIRYYLLDEIHETKFVKTSKFGLQKVKNFLLGDILDHYIEGETTVEDIAHGLRNKVW